MSSCVCGEIVDLEECVRFVRFVMFFLCGFWVPTTYYVLSCMMYVSLYSK